MEFIIGLVVVIFFLSSILGGSGSSGSSSAKSPAVPQPKPTETADMFKMDMAAGDDDNTEA